MGLFILFFFFVVFFWGGRGVRYGRELIIASEKLGTVIPILNW